MKRIKIRIDDDEERARGIYEVMRRGQVIGLRGNIFIVPEPAIALLDEMNVSYENLGEMPWDHVVRALRDSRTSPVQ